ncbi:MAG: hypothetical protein QXU54_01930 [Candidatus Micrarchaeia archaeon]
MAKVALVITRQKKHLRRVRYIHLRLGRDAFAFPPLAKSELKSLGIPDLWVLDSDVPDDKLEQKNLKFLSQKPIHVTAGDKTYSTSLYDELQVLSDWLRHGVCPLEYEEFMQRALALKSELEPVSHYLFDTPSKQAIFEFFVALRDIKRSDGPFPAKSRNLTVVEKERSRQFKDAIMEILCKPRELEEIVALTKVNESNARRWLMKLESQGIVTRTRKRTGIGRPKNIYYLSQRLNTKQESEGQ